MTAVEIARADLHRAGGPISRTGNARATWDRRDSIVVALHDREGRVGLGEAAPLPGMSTDTLEEAAPELRSFRRSDAVEATSLGLSRFAGDLRRDLSSASARFALELAMSDLVGQATRTPTSQLLAIQPSAPSVAVSALLGDLGAAGAIERAVELLGQGARALKVKLGVRSVASDVAALEALRRAIGPDIELFGDANGAWTVDVARRALEMLAPCGLAYVEQPVAPEVLAGLGETAIPVWADESLLQEANRWSTVGAPDVAGVVCKPTLLGGFFTCIEVALRAHRLGKGVVVTHALEGPVALAGCAALALALGAIAPRAGIWPHAALAAYPAIALPGYADGRVVATDRPGLGFTEEERRLILALPKMGDGP